MSAADLTDYADRNVTNRLETVSGVASVNIYGDRPYTMRVWLDPVAMAACGITVNDIAAALEDNNLALPTGQIETGSRAYLLRAETRLSDVAAFDDLILAERGGAQVRLGEVAQVEPGVEDDDSVFRANGETAIGLGCCASRRPTPSRSRRRSALRWRICRANCPRARRSGSPATMLTSSAIRSGRC